MTGDFSLFRVSYSHWIVMLVDVTFASIFCAGYGSTNKYTFKSNSKLGKLIALISTTKA